MELVPSRSPDETKRLFDSWKAECVQSTISLRVDIR
jgi:hypothetical protein